MSNEYVMTYWCGRLDEDIRRMYADRYNRLHPRKKISWRKLNRPQRAEAYELFGFQRLAVRVYTTVASSTEAITAAWWNRCLITATIREVEDETSLY